MIVERCILKEKNVISYRDHIIDIIHRRFPKFPIEVECPECSNQLERGAMLWNEGGGLRRGSAFCGKCGWVGSYLTIKKEE